VRRELECDRGVPQLFDNRYSGLGENRVSVIAGDSGETNLWVGTPCGFSCYSY